MAQGSERGKEVFLIVNLYPNTGRQEAPSQAACFNLFA